MTERKRGRESKEKERKGERIIEIKKNEKETKKRRTNETKKDRERKYNRNQK
jgi:hypothetical protein